MTLNWFLLFLIKAVHSNKLEKNHQLASKIVKFKILTKNQLKKTVTLSLYKIPKLINNSKIKNQEKITHLIKKQNKHQITITYKFITIIKVSIPMKNKKIHSNLIKVIINKILTRLI